MTDSNAQPSALEDFVALSAILTGIPASKLRPTLDTHKTADSYFAFAKQHGDPAFTQMLALYAQHRSDGRDAITALILGDGQPSAGIAHAVMLMWYLGAWYAPAALAAYQSQWAAGLPPPPSVVISSDAYTQGWAWRVGQAHPMGYSDFRFGYWNSAPASLADVVGA